MGIDAVHLNGAMTGIQDYNAMRHQEEARGLLNQTNYQNQFNQKVENKMNQVQSKDDLENQNRKFDAKEKGDNSYSGDGGKRRNNDSQKDGIVKVKSSAPAVGGGFDMKI